MDSNKPMSIIIIEDSSKECEEFKRCIDARADIQLVGVTASSKEGIELVKTYLPEGIILDIELKYGFGSGTRFLRELKELDIAFRPAIIVTTNTVDEILHDKIRSDGVSLVLYKKQKGYSHGEVLNELVSLKQSAYKINSIESAEELPISPAQSTINLSKRVATELDKVGIPTHLKGRKHLQDAIIWLIEHDKDEETQEETVFGYVARMNNKKPSSVVNAMQVAINYAWKATPAEDLEIHYNFKIHEKRGVPSNTEFIYNYKDKLLRNM